MLLGMLVFASAMVSEAQAAVCFTRNANGNWNNSGTWASTLGGAVNCAAPGGVPGANDDAIIANFGRTYTVTANAAARSVTFTGGNQNTTLRINNAVTLTVNAAGTGANPVVTINAPTNNRTKRLDVLAGGILVVNGDMDIRGGPTISELRIGSNAASSVTITGNLTANAANEQVSFSGAGTLNIGGNFSNGGSFVNGTGTVVYNGTGAQNIGAYVYNNLTVNKTAGTATLTGATTVDVDLNVSAGAMAASVSPLTVTGNLTVSSSGSFDAGSASHTVAGNVSNSGTLNGNASTTAITGTFTNSGTFNGGSSVISLQNNFTNSGTFNADTGTFTFSGANAQTITGVTTFNNLTVNKTGNGLTLNNDVTVGSGSSGMLTLTNRDITTGVGNTLIIDSNTSCGVSRTSGHVVGNLRKNFTASQLLCDFEVGDTINYTPITVDFISSTGFSAGTVTAKASASGDHPQIGTAPLLATSSVNRYWMLTPGVGLTFGNAILTFTPIGGAGVDHDNLANVGSYTIQRYDISNAPCDPLAVGYTGAGSWSGTSETGTQTATSIQATDISTFGNICSHFAIALTNVSTHFREREFIYSREVFY